MGAISHLQAIRAGRAADAELRRQVRLLHGESRALEGERAAVEDAHEEALRQLARCLLPGLAPDQVAVAARAARLPGLLARPEALARQAERFRERLAAIEADARYREREALVHPERGRLNRALARLEDEGRALLLKLAVYDDPRFQWLHRRAVHENRSFGPFQTFWRSMTLAARRERKALAGFLAAADRPSFQACLEEYEALVAAQDRRRAEHERLAAERRAVIELIEERDDLEPWVRDPERAILEQLQEELAVQLAEADFAALYGGLPEPARLPAAKAEALAEKAAIFDELAAYLEEMTAERERERQEVERAVKVWQLEPERFLDPADQRGLFEDPEHGAPRIRRALVQARTLVRIVRDFQDFDAYGRYLAGGRPFLAYDAFAYHRDEDEKAPDEAFLRAALPELDAHRRRIDHADLAEPYFRRCQSSAAVGEDAFLEEAPEDEELVDCLDPEDLVEESADEPGVEEEPGEEPDFADELPG